MQTIFNSEIRLSKNSNDEKKKVKPLYDYDDLKIYIPRTPPCPSTSLSRQNDQIIRRKQPLITITSPPLKCSTIPIYVTQQTLLEEEKEKQPSPVVLSSFTSAAQNLLMTSLTIAEQNVPIVYETQDATMFIAENSD